MKVMTARQTNSGGVYTYVIRAAQTLFELSQVVELRAIFKNGRVDSGYFDNFELLAKAAVKLDERPEVSGIYLTLNPVNPDCLHRAKNHVREWASKSKGRAATSDAEILERRFILLDFDGANRPSGISATSDELEAAKHKAYSVAKFLAGYGWGTPIAAMSGNGYYLLYRTALPNDRQCSDLLKRYLVSLAVMFDDEKTRIDTSVFNASRICKVYGTMARKGDDTPERPHRRSALLRTAGEKTLIMLEQIEAIAVLMPEDKPRKAGRPSRNTTSLIDVPLWIAEHLGHITITGTKVRNGTTLYVLSECPFDTSHKAPDSVIGQMPSGAVFFKCFHNSCQGYGWKELRERFCPKDASRAETETASHKDTGEAIEALRESTGLPVIEVGGGQLRDTVDAVISALEGVKGENGPLVYVRGGSLARIVADSDGRLRPNIVSPGAMPEIMSRAANFVRTGKNGCVEIFPPESLSTAVINRGDLPFPELRGIAEIPVLREDGSVLKIPGYDSMSKLYYHPAGPVPDIPDNLTKEDAVRASRFVLDILSDFPFQDDASRDNAMGMLGIV